MGGRVEPDPVLGARSRTAAYNHEPQTPGNPGTRKTVAMLLAADIGNTHTAMGLYDGEQLVAHWRLTTAEY